jgi:hypothetical protein
MSNPGTYYSQLRGIKLYNYLLNMFSSANMSQMTMLIDSFRTKVSLSNAQID